jgi:hypothetical protein
MGSLSTLQTAVLSIVVLGCLATSTAFQPMRDSAPRLVRPSSQLFYQSNHEVEPYVAKMPTAASIGDEARREWIDKSLEYYSKVMREERRRNLGQVKDYEEYSYDFLLLAKKHYFALRKIKAGQYHHAERIYRRIIDELLSEDDGECDHAKLAVTTLLLALHLQRTGDARTTRSVFLSFFRIVRAEAAKEPNHECACSAKVLQAFALFEMKQGNVLKSLDIVLIAIKLDPTLQPVLKWKQFQDAMEQRARRQTRS